MRSNLLWKCKKLKSGNILRILKARYNLNKYYLQTFLQLTTMSCLRFLEEMMNLEIAIYTFSLEIVVSPLDALKNRCKRKN